MKTSNLKSSSMSIVLLGVFFLFCPLTTSVFSSAENLPVELKVNPSTGAISELKIRGDERDMNWLVKVDGTQYAWVKENYGWGLGYFTITKGRESIKSAFGLAADKPQLIKAGYYKPAAHIVFPNHALNILIAAFKRLNCSVLRGGRRAHYRKLMYFCYLLHYFGRPAGVPQTPSGH